MRRGLGLPRLGAEQGLSGEAVLPHPQPPAGLTKEHIRVALTAQGVRYAVLAQVGTSGATPAFRLSAPSLEQGAPSAALVSRAPGVLVLDRMGNIGGFISHFF